ncbi:MAG: hypothetical protein ACRDKW_16575, partial [Actinomycetota bacterium]
MPSVRLLAGVAAAAVLLTGCPRTGGDGGPIERPPGPAPEVGVTFEGAPVRGALVGVLVTGIPAEHAGKDASVTFHAWEEQASAVAGLPRTIGDDGSVRLEFFVPGRIPREPCVVGQPCDAVPVELKPGYGVQVTTDRDVLADADITPVAAQQGIAYITLYDVECGQARVRLDGAVWAGGRASAT